METYDFLDSCIFLSRAYGPRLEKWSGHCDRLFCCGSPLYTSESICDQLERVENRRRRLYTELLDCISSKGTPHVFDLSHLSDNDREHFLKLVRCLGKMKKDAALVMARSFLQRIALSLDDSRRRVEKPVVPRYGNALHEDLVCARIGNRDDSRAVCDFINWGLSRGTCRFVTLDWGDILSNRDAILQFVTDYFNVDSPDLHFVHVNSMGL